ncbi:MAG: thiamine-phosphate kinase [Gammaproteobacteria bacterium]
MAFGEFDLIKKYFLSSSNRADVSLGIGDDCAIVSIPEGRELAVTTDTLVDTVHFPAGTAPEDIAYKAIAVNLSDLAAMGATPAWLTLALSLPSVDEDWVKAFSDTFKKTAGQYNVQLIGGDTTRGPLSITVQALGLIDPAHCMRRDSASPGDAIYVSGTLGDAATGLRIIQQGQAADRNETWLINRLNRPEPRVELGIRVAAYCKCAIDISDGLAADLGHVLAASHCGATVYKDRLPLSRQLVEYSINRDEVDWELVLAGGDDYELCLVVAADNEDKLLSVAGELSLPLTRIGVIEQQQSLSIIDRTGAKLLLDDTGYEHFSK